MVSAGRYVTNLTVATGDLTTSRVAPSPIKGKGAVSPVRAYIRRACVSIQDVQKLAALLR